MTKKNSEPTMEERKAALRKELRYRIMSDDSGHKYYVPVDETKIFEMWLETFEEGWDPEFEEYNGPDYEENRIDGRFTFSDPRCD